MKRVEADQNVARAHNYELAQWVAFSFNAPAKMPKFERITSAPSASDDRATLKAEALMLAMTLALGGRVQ